MEHGEGWFEGAEDVFDVARLGRSGDPMEMDARMAAWVSRVSPPAAARYLDSGLSLPAPERERTGTGAGWQDRAVASVLTECYARAMLDPNRERVEVVALCVMPLPPGAEGEGEESCPHLSPPRQRWECAVSEVSGKVSGLLRHGPTARFTAGELLASGREIYALRDGLRLRQRVDLLWRYPDGGIEAVIVAGEPDFGDPPGFPSEDWRVILAAEIVRLEWGRIPEVHLARVCSGVAQAARPSRRHLNNCVHRLVRAVAEARGGQAGTQSEQILQNGFTYPLTFEAIAPLQRGDWPGGRYRSGGRPNPRK